MTFFIGDRIFVNCVKCGKKIHSTVTTKTGKTKNNTCRLCIKKEKFGD